MTNKTIISAFLLIVVLGLFSACKKDNNGNQEPTEPDTPIVTNQIPPIDEYMPERLLQLFDSLNVLHRGDTPPTITGDFMADTMNRLIVNKVPESHWITVPGMIPLTYYYELKDQENNRIRVTFKKPNGNPQEQYSYFMEKSDTDSTYIRIKDNTALFTNDPIAPPYFRSSTFSAEDFRHAYIIGNGDCFTLYYYEIRDISNGSLPLNAVLISGKMSTDAEGNPIIEDFWYGIETMKYYSESSAINTLIQLGYMPHPGDILIMQSPDSLSQGSYEE